MTKKKNQDKEYQYVPLDDPSMVFTTYDLGVSAALICEEFELLDLDKNDPRKALFIFRREGPIEDRANQYFLNQLTVKARSFFDTIKALKNQLYSE